MIIFCDRRRRPLSALPGFISALCLLLSGCASNSGATQGSAKFKAATPPADFIAQKMKLRMQGPQPGTPASPRAGAPAAGKPAGE